MSEQQEHIVGQLYILGPDGQTPIRTKDRLMWMVNFRTNRVIEQTSIARDGKTYLVSTVFLGMMHVGGLFETMIFVDPASKEDILNDMQGNRPPRQALDWQWRYMTYDEAKEGHRHIVEAIERGLRVLEDIEP